MNPIENKNQSQKSVMVFIEVQNGKIADVSLELACKATELARQLGVTACGICIGHNQEQNLEVFDHYGLQKIYSVNNPRLANFLSVPYAKGVAQLIRKHAPQIVLFGATTNGRDIAPRIASELKCGLTADCTDLQIGDHELKDKKYHNILMQIRPAFGGNIIATIVSPESTPSMATVREGVMKLTTPNPNGRVEIISETLDLSEDDFLSEVIEIITKEKSVNLKSANIIVAAGMGAASDENLKLIKELANTIGGVVGCSRPVVDGNILPKEHQVGQTGVTVRPTLYIACGISGQIQHRAGMSEAKRIIAINKDPQAPIFQIAHYGIVGDISEVIPRMIKAYKNN